MALTTNSHPAPRLKKEYSYTATPRMRLQGLFYSQVYLTFTFTILHNSIAVSNSSVPDIRHKGSHARYIR